MYSRILVGLDGSQCSDHAANATIDLAKSFGSKVVACHVYAAEMHRARFGEMEIGLPQRYQRPEKLEHLRDTHEDIISGGMKMISDAYLAQFVNNASTAGLSIETRTPEGRNYVQYLNVLRESGAELSVVGAEGLGKVPEASLGSFAERALLLGGRDILIVRREWALKDRPIVVGVDGSEDSYSALRLASELASRYGTTVRAVAVYDPFFHTGVFTSISSALTKEQANRFNFEAQEKLHDEIIDDGLRALYEKRVIKGIEMIGPSDARIEREILTGKVFSQLAYYANVMNAGLVVVGRYGVHREDTSLIGSTAHALARICPTNLLVVACAPGSLGVREASTAVSATKMDLASAQIPPRAKPAKIDEVLAPSSSAERRVEALAVTLKKAKRLAPAFHEHIVRTRIVGSDVEVGTRFMVFDVVRTEPGGRVTVTERTKLEFV